jgi:hypothetical protein
MLLAIVAASPAAAVVNPPNMVLRRVRSMDFRGVRLSGSFISS